MLTIKKNKKHNGHWTVTEDVFMIYKSDEQSKIKNGVFKMSNKNNIEKKYLEMVQLQVNATKRQLREKIEAMDIETGYYNALSDNGLNTNFIDCIHKHFRNYLLGTTDMKKASEKMLQSAFKTEL